MPLGNVWSFPRTTDLRRHARRHEGAGRRGSPKITARLQGVRPSRSISMWRSSRTISRPPPRISAELKLAEPIPKLCTLVTASAVRRRHTRCLRQAARPQLLSHLRPGLHDARSGALPGRRSSRANIWTTTSLREPKPRMPLYHLVGALDPIEDADIRKRIDDGLPETLAEWIRYNGLTHLKIKLNGDDLKWDVDRVVRVDRVAGRRKKARRRKMGLLARLQREVPERGLPARFPAPGEGEDAGRLRAHPVRRAAHRARPEGAPRKRDARGLEAAAGGDRRIADRPGEPDAGARDGLHRARRSRPARGRARRC